MIIIMVSTALSYVLARLGVTEVIANFCHTYISSPLGFLAFVIIINIISGCFIDANAWMMMMLPILWPIMQTYGIPELQFALVFVVSLLTGGITPPVGMYLFIICGVDGTPLRATFKYIIPFLLCELIVIAFMSVFPQISYFVPGLMGLKFTKVAKACMPFIAIMLLVLAIIAFCPKLILFLPNLLYGA